MTVRRASTALRMIPVKEPLAPRESPKAPPEWGALEWQGDVRMAADRASGISAAAWQEHVRKGLFERILALGANHRAGPHWNRPEAGRRILAHLDALGEAGLTPDDVTSLAEEADLEHPGALWILTLLFTCFDVSGGEEAFEAWVEALDPSLFSRYPRVLEIADALAIHPNPLLRQRVKRWPSGSCDVLAAAALEATSPDAVSDAMAAELLRKESPLIQVALERLVARSPEDRHRTARRSSLWIEIGVPSLSFELARLCLLRREMEPLFRLRQRDPAALEALGAYSLDVLALGADEGDNALAGDLARGLPTSADLLDAMGRVGLPSLFPRLLAELEGDELDEEAHDALTTALGPRAPRPSKAAWEQALASLPKASEDARLRGGAPYSTAAVLDEMRREDLSAAAVRARADEIARRPLRAEFEAFGVPLEGVLSELTQIVRGGRQAT